MSWLRGSSTLLLAFLVHEIAGHGMMLEPPNRSSLWRFDSSAVANYDDNQIYCGGLTMMWSTFGGRCGVCGDRYDAPHPQPNENTGKYGQGKVVREYRSGTIIDVMAKLTTNHRGYFEFSLCVLTNPNAPESGEDCFQALTMADGSKRYPIVTGMEEVNVQVQLPRGLTCDRCVLRWQYTAGNNWGQCDDGSYAEGCGPQETFRTCADVAIH